MRVVEPQSREEWLALRRQGIGASDAATIVGANPWKSPMALFAEKLGITESSVEETEAMEWGHLLEPVIDTKFRKETGRVTRDPGDFTMQFADGSDVLFATLDREIVEIPASDPMAACGPGIAEYKTTSEFRRADWDEDVPLYYQIQVQHQMMVTGAGWASVACLIGGQSFVYKDLRRNENFIAALRAEEERFWRCVQTKTPPPIDGSEATRAVLKALHPKVSIDDMAAGDADLLEVAIELANAKAAEKVWADKVRLCENKIIAAIGDKLGIVLPNGTVFTYKEQKRASYTVAETTFRVLRRKGE